MKKIKCSAIILSLILLTGLAAACKDSKAGPTPNPNEVVTTITPAPTAAPTEEPEATEIPVTPEPTAEATPEPTPDPNFPVNIEGFDSRGQEFTLTDEEQELYESYKENLDISVFKDADPFAIAKIFIQCGIDGLWEAEFTLYSERGLTITKQQWHELHVRDVITIDISSRKSMADAAFPYLKDGVFEETGDNLGHITFSQFNGEEAKLRMVKNDDGIWLIKYNPFDPWEDEVVQDAEDIQE